MAFFCSILLSDIDINCNTRVTGGIKKAILALQENVIIALNPFDETIVDSVDVLDYVVFEHNKKDGTTSFSESKNTSNGLGVITTDIAIQSPAVGNKINKIDYMSRREDIVAILLHNNDSVTISGWLDGLTMNYEANSGTGVSEKSYVNITLNTESGIASLVMDDKSAFTDQTIFE